MPYAEYHGSGSFGAFSTPGDLMYSSRLTPGDPYLFSAGHTPTPDPYWYSDGHTPDPTAFGAVQTPPTAFRAVQTRQSAFGAGKIPDPTMLEADQTPNPTPDQTAIRATKSQDSTSNSLSAAGFAATSSTPHQAPGFSWMEFIEISF